MAGFYLDGKFMEPRSDDTLQKLAKNLEKQQAGSITRRIESEMVFLGTDLYDSYAVKKGYLRGAEFSATTAGQAQQLLQVLKRSLETSPAVCLHQQLLQPAELPTELPTCSKVAWFSIAPALIADEPFF